MPIEPNPTPSPTTPERPQYGPAPQREGRSVSFYLAIFLALLLCVSGALNLVLLFVSAVGSATSGFGSVAEEDDAFYEIVSVAGDLDADRRILRVPIHGAIAEVASPLIGAAGGTVTQVTHALRYAARDASIGGVVLDIDSPGGGVTDSDEIWRAVREFREEHDKPVVALLGDIAASGGYYVAVACDRIIARETTVTGSIGVILSSYNVADAAARFGISEVTIVSKDTPYKAMLSPMKPVDPAERAIAQSIVEEMYERFVEVVDEGRPELTRDDVRRLANGQIYSAKQALRGGLVDALGTEDDAYQALRTLMGVESAHVVERRRRPSLRDMLFGASAAARSLDATVASALHSLTGARFLYFWPGGR